MGVGGRRSRRGVQSSRGTAPASIDWFVAADDRWHRPQHEASTRQTVLDGTPVVETRVRIPGGDAVQRVYSVADAGGLTIIEVTNDSTLPIAVAFTGGGLLSRRPPTSMPPQGIDLPADAVIFPVGHQATLVVARSACCAATRCRSRLPSADQVSRGWLAQTQRASRLQLPDASMVEAVTSRALRTVAQRTGRRSRPTTTWILQPSCSASLSWCGWAISRRSGCQTSPPSWSDWPGLAPRSPAGTVEAAARVLHAAGEDRAVADLRRMGLSSQHDHLPDEMPAEPALVPSWAEHSW